jgi:phenylpropionate dioxygenase-like ring-hydroxylating dioxygenase large terminal subunit
MSNVAIDIGAQTPKKLTDQEVTNYLKTGLRNRWWPILASRFVETGGKPVAITRLGEPLVLWRDSAGEIHVQTDRCPHRAVPISKGTNEGDRLRCRYHGVEVGPDGTVLSVPGQPGCPLEGKKAVKTYPTIELADAVFAWFGDRLHEQAGAFNPPPQLADPEYSSFLCYADWDAAWRYNYDNFMDPMHGTFLHANSHSMFQGSVQAKFATRDMPTGYIFEKLDQRDVNFDWSELVDDGMLFARLEVPYPPSAGPGGNFGIIAFSTPVDEDNTSVFIWRVRKVSGWQRDIWRFLYRAKLEERHWHVLEQDRDIMQGARPGLEKYEMLYSHDAGVIRLRRHLAQAARQQLEQLAADARPNLK